MPGTPLPVIAMAIAGGAIVIYYGAKNTKTAIASSSTTSSTASTAAASSTASTAATSSTDGSAPTVSIPGIPSDTAQSIIADAATAHGVPLGVFYGMFNNETALGSDVTDSSAGAVGPFQFIPSTAASYGYPLTNTPTVTQLTQQANAAATLLASDFQTTGSWEGALAAYNAGPYNTGAGMGYAQQAISWAQAHGLPVS